MIFFRNRFFSGMIILFLLNFPGFSQEQVQPQDLSAHETKNLSLKEIDRMIEATDYNTALQCLTEYIKIHPEDFDRAQKRVAKVLKARETYNQTAAKLVDMIKTEGGDQIEKLEKITALEKSELNPTKTVSEFTGLARRTVTLGDVLISYNRIMHQGIRLIESGKYAEAAAKFEEGFMIKNELSDVVFEEVPVSQAMNEDESMGKTDSEKNTASEQSVQSGQEEPLYEKKAILVEYESDIVEPVNAAVSNIKSLQAGTFFTPGFKSLLSECDSAYNEFIRNVNAKNYEASERSYEKVRASFGKLASLRNSIMKEARTLDRMDKLANERNPLLLGTSYITFYQRFVLGDETNANTGVIGAMDAFWNTRVEAMKARINEVVYSTLEKFQSEIPYDKIFENADKIAGQQKNLALAENFSALAINVQGLYGLPENLDGTPVGAGYKNYSESMAFVKGYLADLILSYGSAQKIASEERHVIPESSENSRIEDGMILASIEKVRRFLEIQNDSRTYLARIEEEKLREDEYFEQKVKNAEEAARQAMQMEESGLSVPARKVSTAGTEVSDEPADLRPAINYFISVNNQNIGRATDHERDLWGYLAQAYLQNGNISYSEIEKRIQDAEKLLEGEAEGSYIKKYPREAKISVLEIAGAIKDERQKLTSERNTLEEGEKFRESEARYVSGTDGIEKLIEKFDSLTLKCNEVARNADVQIRLANLASDEGHAQYEKALAAFKKNDFASANAAIDASSEKYAESLDHQFDEKIRMMREETLADLASRIMAAENEKVIRDVFELKEKATAYYYSSDFDSAENTLVKAQTLWATTNTEADPEIEELLASVKNVKSLEFGRVLLSSDPHYPELSSSLNMAKLSFERGIDFKKAGKKNEAEEAFNISLTNIRNVQNVYPLNKEARLISLKIQQELDPEGFPRQFENQYNAAKLNTKLNERLADLQDLHAINPKYPGLSKEIYDLEEQLGMHPKKEVKADVKKQAAAKLAEAKSIMKKAGTSETELNRALNAVNQAILLDSTNSEAKNLKLQIQLKVGAQTTAILTQADEKLYAEAGRLFNQRKFSEANDIMTELWKSGAARKSRKVIDLRNRIARRL